MKLSIIFPCFNEELNIPYIEKELYPVLEKLKIKHELIFVDDGSKDNTNKLIQKLGEKRKNIKLLTHHKNRGLGVAIRTGIKHCDSDVTITMDSDLTFHPRYIPMLIARFKKNDVDCVIGSPTLLGYDKSIPLYRIILSKGVNKIYNIILRKKLTAISPIFRIYKTNQIQNLKLKSNGFEINAEILAKLLMKKANVTEIPAELTTRIYGESKLNNIKEIKNHLKLISKIIFWQLTY